MTTIDIFALLRDHPKACERLGLAVDSEDGHFGVLFNGDIFYEEPAAPRLFEEPDGSDLDFQRWLTGLAFLWLAERNAHPQWYQSLSGGQWDVVLADKSGGYILLVERADTPLEAMLEAIETWEEQV